MHGDDRSLADVAAAQECTTINVRLPFSTQEKIHISICLDCWVHRPSRSDVLAFSSRQCHRFDDWANHVRRRGWWSSLQTQLDRRFIDFYYISLAMGRPFDGD